MSAREFVKAELARPPKRKFVQQNLSLEENVVATIARLSSELGWSKAKVVSTAVRALVLLIEERNVAPEVSEDAPRWLHDWAREQVDAHYEARAA